MRTLIVAIAALLALLTGLISPALAASPSFDCAKAKLPDEKAICANADLSALDVDLNAGYQATITALGKKKAANLNRTILRQRKACKANASCIAKTGQSALRVFMLAAPAFKPAVELTSESEPDYNTWKKHFKPGDCTLSTITELGPRLCEPDASGNCPANAPFDDSGNTIGVKTGLYGVSYDRITALERSKIGDIVLLCLKSLPTDCPKDDDRGYWWAWENLRTKGKWELPDSQHMCGGA